MINSFKNPAIMRILRTTERHGAGWREQNFIPDDEAHRLKKPPQRSGIRKKHSCFTHTLPILT